MSDPAGTFCWIHSRATSRVSVPLERAVEGDGVRERQHEGDGEHRDRHRDRHAPGARPREVDELDADAHREQEQQRHDHQQVAVGELLPGADVHEVDDDVGRQHAGRAACAATAPSRARRPPSTTSTTPIAPVEVGRDVVPEPVADVLEAEPAPVHDLALAAEVPEEVRRVEHDEGRGDDERHEHRQVHAQDEQAQPDEDRAAAGRHAARRPRARQANTAATVAGSTSMPRLYLVDVASPAATAPATSQRGGAAAAGPAPRRAVAPRPGPVGASRGRGGRASTRVRAARCSRTSASSEKATAVTSVTAMCE